MVERKSTKEVLSDYSSKQLTDILIEELKTVGIEYMEDPNGHESEFVPLRMED